MTSTACALDGWNGSWNGYLKPIYMPTSPAGDRNHVWGINNGHVDNIQGWITFFFQSSLIDVNREVRRHFPTFLGSLFMLM